MASLERQIDQSNKLKGEADEDNSSKADASKNQIDPAAEKLIKSDNPRVTGKNANQDFPGRRLKNPLGEFASYTYQISLYMLTPDAYEAFITSGRRNINVFNNVLESGSGAYLIAQSGGINDKTTQRAPGFELDYYIDNLQISSYTDGKSTHSSHNTTEINFTITEPYGFTFLSNLKRTSNAIKQYSKSLGLESLQNPSKQIFVVGIRFYGYDANGSLLTGKENYDGLTLDETGSTNGLFEIFYDVLVSAVKFQLDGKIVNYTINTVSLPSKVAFGSKRGVINSTIPITGTTVTDALIGPKGLLTALNAEQEDQLKAKTVSKKNTYKLEFIGDSESIANATLVSPADLDKYRLPVSTATKSSEVTDATAIKSTPNFNARNLTFNPGTPILNAVQQIVVQSSYLEDALKTIYQANLQPDDKKKDNVDNRANQNINLKWYNLSVRLSNIDWDDLRGDFVYTMTYVMQPYETPFLQNAYTSAGGKYYGPHKRYEYWFTGQNREVLKYTQVLNNNFYVAYLGDTTTSTDKNSTTDLGKGGDAGISRVPGQRQPMPRLGRLNVGMEAQNALITDLQSPGDFAQVTVNILGDPDFLISDSNTSREELYSQFYGSNGFSINANGGQVFIEIDFKEGVDYSTNTGLFSINESIRFWKYPKVIEDVIKGIVYKVIKVNSSFKGGRFEQTLTCVIATFDSFKDPPDAARPAENQQVTSGPTSNGTGTTEADGLRPDPVLPTRTSEASTQPDSTNALPIGQSSIGTRTGTVADDDSPSMPSATNTTNTSSDVENNRSNGPIFDGTTWYDERGNPIPPRD